MAAVRFPKPEVVSSQLWIEISEIGSSFISTLDWTVLPFLLKIAYSRPFLSSSASSLKFLEWPKQQQCFSALQYLSTQHRSMTTCFRYSTIHGRNNTQRCEIWNLKSSKIRLFSLFFWVYNLEYRKHVGRGRCCVDKHWSNLTGRWLLRRICRRKHRHKSQKNSEKRRILELYKFHNLLPNPPPPGSTHPDSDHAECSFEYTTYTNICFRIQILRISHLPVKLLQCLSTQHRPLLTCFRYSKLYTQKDSENKRILELYKFHNSLAPSLCVVSAMNGRISETRRHRSVLYRQILKRTEALLLLRPL